MARQVLPTSTASASTAPDRPRINDELAVRLEGNRMRALGRRAPRRSHARGSAPEHRVVDWLEKSGPGPMASATTAAADPPRAGTSRRRRGSNSATTSSLGRTLRPGSGRGPVARRRARGRDGERLGDQPEQLGSLWRCSRRSTPRRRALISVQCIERVTRISSMIPAHRPFLGRDRRVARRRRPRRTSCS